jgi:hypothetical protein
VTHALNLHDGLIGLGFEHTVVTAASGVFGIHVATQRIAPEISGFINIGRFAVDQHGA